MVIRHLEIQNFRNIEYADISLADSNFCIGQNEQGKSTIQNAVQLALAGWCEHTDRRGAGYQALIRDGAKSAEITVRTDRYQVTLKLGKKREAEWVDLETGEVIQQPQLFTDREALVCMFPSQIVGSKEFSEILTARLLSSVTPDALANEVPIGRRAYVENFAAQHRVKLTSVDAYTHLGGLAYDHRRDVNRDLKLVTGTIEEIGFLKPVTAADGERLSADDIPALNSEVARLRESINKLHRQLGAAESAPSPDRRSELEIRIAGLETDEAAAAVARDYEAKRAELEGLQKRADAAPTECPTCGGKMTEARRKKYLADVLAEIEDIGNIGEHPGWPVDYDADALRQARADLNALPPVYTGPSADDCRADIAKAETEIAATEKLLTALQQHKQLAEAEAHRKHLEHEQENAQWLVEQFHEGRATKKLLAEAMQPIVSAANAALPSGAITIEPEGKAFTLYFDGRPLHLASRGRKAMTAYAIAAAFADCGAPILLDDVNDLDPANRKAVMTWARQQTGRTVVLAGTPLTREIPLDDMARAVSPMQVIFVNDGNCRVVPAEKEHAA